MCAIPERGAGPPVRWSTPPGPSSDQNQFGPGVGCHGREGGHGIYNPLLNPAMARVEGVPCPKMDLIYSDENMTTLVERLWSGARCHVSGRPRHARDGDRFPASQNPHHNEPSNPATHIFFYMFGFSPFLGFCTYPPFSFSYTHSPIKMFVYVAGMSCHVAKTAAPRATPSFPLP